MKNNINVFIAGFITLGLVACGGGFSIVNEQYENDLGATYWSMSESDKDNAVITMYPNVMASASGDTADLKLGMIWTQSSPNEILLILAQDAKAPAGNFSLDSLNVTIDGQVTRFKPVANKVDFQGYNAISKAAYQQGRASVRMSLDYMRKMINGADVQVSVPGFSPGLFHRESLRVTDKSYLLLAKRTFKEALSEISRETKTPIGFELDHFDPAS